MLFNRLFLAMTKPWVLILFLFFLALAFFYVDRPLAEYFQALNLQNNFKILNWLTNLGLGIIYIAGFLLATLFFRYRSENALWEARFFFLWLCVVLTGGICVVLKILFGRARPDMWFHGKFYGFYGLQSKATFWSFPSGHTSTMMAIAFGLCVLFPRYSLLYIAGGFLLALSRVFLVHHYLTDVLSATCFAVLEIGLMIWVLKKNSWLEVLWKDQGATLEQARNST